jgi:hypothetical protein
VLDDLEYDDSEPPAIALVPAGVPWEDIQDHIKIAHHPLVVLPAGGTELCGGLLDRNGHGRDRGPGARSGPGHWRIPAVAGRT